VILGKVDGLVTLLAQLATARIAAERGSHRL
jgi:hypothetical protein